MLALLTFLAHCAGLAAAASSSSVLISTSTFGSSAAISGSAAAAPSAPSISPAAVCTGCLLEAFNPLTLQYPGSVSGNVTVTTASVNAYPTVYPDGRTLTVRYETTILTLVVPNTTDTIIASASWSTYGTWLTWPTSYIIYNNFGLATQCAAAVTPLALPQSTDAVQLIYPLVGDMSGVPKAVEAYLNTLDLPDNSTDLTTCSWAVLGPELARRWGKRPIPFGPRNAPWPGIKPKKRAVVGTNPAATQLQTAFVLTDTTSTQAPFTVPLPSNGGGTSGSTGTQNPTPPDQPAQPNPPTQPDQPAAPAQPETQDPGAATGQQQQGSNLAGNVVGAVLGTNADAGSGTDASTGSDSGSGTTGSGTGAGTGSGTGSGSSNPQVVNVGGQPIVVAPAGQGSDGGVVVAGQTLQSGQVATVNGQQVSVAPGGNLVVGAQTVQAGQAATIGGQQVSVAPGGNLVVAGQTLQPGQAATVNGQAVSVAAGGGLVVGAPQTVTILPAAAPSPPSITVGGSVVSANPSGAFVVAPGVTLAPGGPAVTVSGTVLSLAPGGTIAIINGATQTLAPSPSNPTGAPVLVVDGHSITANIIGSQTAFIISPGQTLTPGGSIIVSGTTYSLPATGSVVLINGTPTTLAHASPLTTPPPSLTINGATISPTVLDGKTYYSISPGITLTPGGAVTLSGTRISLADNGSSLIFGTSTSAVRPASVSAKTTTTTTTSASHRTTTSSKSGNVGNAIASGIGVTKKGDAAQLGGGGGGTSLEGAALGLVGLILYWI